jgi:16S rRNA (guanine(966)-N(2))-methyltransferase RsmD
MRIISGKFKGHILKVPKGVGIRPTSEKVKKALFDILGPAVSGASFLELFAGSASVGLEARSRGASRVLLVENNRICVKTIRENLAKLKLLREPDVLLLPVDVQEAWELLSRQGERFDFIFLDPPYAQGHLKNCLIKITQYDILNPRSYVIAEHGKEQILPQGLAKLKLMFTRRYGDSALSFYQKEG